MTFHDHFSDASEAYRDARPSYPRGVFEWLASVAPHHDRAWDCACGTGQAAVPLAEFFDRVDATDASAAQIAAAIPHKRVNYRVATAEESGFEDRTFDLVCVAQAAHWLDHEAFASEVRRVLKPDGLLAYLTYGIHHVSPEVDAVVMRYYTEIIGSYWPPERHHVDEHYRDLPFPFHKIVTPTFEIVLDWDLDQLLAYLGTWSATKEYVKKNGKDPRALVANALRDAWGESEQRQTVTWPLTVIAGYPGTSSGS